MLSLSPAQCRPQITAIALGQEVLLPSWRPTRDAADSPGGLGVGLGCRSTSCSLLQPSLLGKPKASTLECPTVQGLWWRWMNPAQCFREVLKGRFEGTMSDGLHSPQKSSSTVSHHFL